MFQGTGVGSYATTSVGGFNDGQWHYVRVRRQGNNASLTNGNGLQLTTVNYGGLSL